MKEATIYLMVHRGLLFTLCVFLAACGAKQSPLDVLEARTVIFPNGEKARAEVEIKQADMMRGMMFRESLPRGNGMLFVHTSPGQYGYWMYQVKIPLDMIWMDANHRITEIVSSAPPCQTKASQCPTYGGNTTALFVLELGAGEARRLGLQVGDTLRF